MFCLEEAHSHHPRLIPTKLHNATSSTQESHQHSLKFFSQCWKVSSINSNDIEYAHNSGKFLNAIAFPYHPRMCPTKNSSKTVVAKHQTWNLGLPGCIFGILSIGALRQFDTKVWCEELEDHSRVSSLLTQQEHQEKQV